MWLKEMEFKLKFAYFIAYFIVHIVRSFARSNFPQRRKNPRFNYIIARNSELLVLGISKFRSFKVLLL